MVDVCLVVSVILLPCCLASQSLAQPRQGDPRWLDSMHFATHKFQMPSSICPKGAGWWKIKVEISGSWTWSRGWNLTMRSAQRTQGTMAPVTPGFVKYLLKGQPLTSQYGVRSIRWCRPGKLCRWLRCMLCAPGSSLAMHLCPRHIFKMLQPSNSWN